MAYSKINCFKAHKANKFKIQDLKIKCVDIFCDNISMDNVLKLVIIDNENNANIFKKSAIRFINDIFKADFKKQPRF